MKLIRALLATALLSASAIAGAQTSNEDLMSVNIPFTFQVNGKSLPAGHYMVIKAGAANFLKLQEIDGRHAATVLANRDPYARVENQYSLIFARIGAQHRLSQVQCGFSGLIFEIPQSNFRHQAGASSNMVTLVADPPKRAGSRS